MTQDLSYRTTPYLSLAYPEASLETIQLRAYLNGWAVKSSKNFRVLEIGCASGGNLIPMAVRNPETQFFGIDAASNQIEVAKSNRNYLGLKNIFFVAEDFESYSPPDSKAFDVIIAHGLLSWIRPDQQQSLISKIKSWSHSQSLVYLSHNCYPAWHNQNLFRELLRFELDLLGEPKNEEREEWKLFAEWLMTNSKLSFDRSRFQSIFDKPWSLLRHDELEEENHPFRFTDFIRLIEDHGFEYLTDTLCHLPHHEVLTSLKSPVTIDWKQSQSLHDFLTGRLHRNSLFVPKGNTNEKISKIDVFKDLHFQASLKEESEHIFIREGHSKVRAQSPGLAFVLRTLNQIFPGSLSGLQIQQKLDQFNLCANREERNQVFAQVISFAEAGILQMFFKPVLYSKNLLDRPVRKTNSVLFSGFSNWAVNTAHQSVSLTENQSWLLHRCDGLHTRTEIELHYKTQTKNSTSDFENDLYFLQRHLLIE